MKLKGFQSTDIKYLMNLAKLQQRENEPIKIKLYIKNGENIRTVKSDLEKRYKAKDMETFDLLSKKDEDVLMFASVPAKNLSKVLKKDYVNNYGWPEELEVSSTSNKKASRSDILVPIPAMPILPTKKDIATIKSLDNIFNDKNIRGIRGEE